MQLAPPLPARVSQAPRGGGGARGAASAGRFWLPPPFQSTWPGPRCDRAPLLRATCRPLHASGEGRPLGTSGRVLHPTMPEAGLKLVVPSLSLSLCFENIFIDIHFILFNEVIQMYKSNFPLDITMIRVDTQRP